MLQPKQGSGTNYTIKWSIWNEQIHTKGTPLTAICAGLSEKLYILTANRSTLLNKRSELITKSRPENKFYAANQKQDLSNYTLFKFYLSNF